MKLLRLFMTLAWIVIFGSSLFAQAPNLELNLRYNTTLGRYEVYARPTATQPTFNWGPSQISIVAPAAVSDAAFNVTSVAAGAWQDNSNIYAPAAAPTSDFHGVGSLGAPISFTSGVEVLIFHFTLSGGGCVPGLRLYINGTDPDSGAPGMQGGDFYNTIFAIVPGVPGGYEAYVNNYNNTGTSCNAPPTAVNDLLTTPEDTPFSFNPLSNDTDDGMLVPSTLDLDPTTPGIQTTYTIPNQGTFVAVPATGVVTFTPVLNYNGTTTPFPYSICDNGTPSLCAQATISVIVTPVNDPPVAVNDVATTPEEVPVNIPILNNDSDLESALNPLTVDLDNTSPGIQMTFTVPNQGTYVVNPSGVVTFTPVTNFTGVATPVIYNVCDSGTPLPAQCASATITVTVTPLNDPPVAVNDVATTPEDTPVNITILANDSDVDGSLVPSTIDLNTATAGIQTSITVPGQGTFTVNGAGVVTFTPVLNYNGTTTPVTYSVCDDGTPLPSQCAQATITVTVVPVNDPPVAVNDVATTPEDTPVTITILANDTDSDGSLVPTSVDLDPLTAGIQTSFTVPNQGTFTVNGAGVVTFTPVLNYNGTTTPITYSVCDNGTPLPAQCATATITVTVTPVNDPPVAVNDVATTTEDTPVNITILANDSDVDGALVPSTVDLDPLTAGIQTTFTVAGQGTFTVNPAGVVTFTPVLNYNGTTTPITYSVCDNGTPLPSQCASATITVTVTPANDPPVAVNDVATTPEDTPVTISILANDSDTDGALVPTSVDLDPLTAGIQTSFTVPGQGTFTVNAAGVVTFTPVLNYNGTTTPITYSVCDNGTPLPSQCATATITVTVTPVNDPPVAVNDVATTPEDSPVTITILANDSDVDGALVPSTVDLDPGTPGIQTTFTIPGQGVFTVNPSGVVTFTPVLNFNGTTTPTPYSVCDNGTPLPAQCATATITVTVTPVNDPPVAVNDVATTPEDTPVPINILANDTDTDGTLVPGSIDLDPGTSGTQTSFTVPGQGTFVVNTTTGVVTFTPVLNYNGTTTPIPYSVCDNGTPLPAQCATATITVTVTPANDPPVAVNDVATTPEDTPVPINILANDSDVDGTLVPGTVDLDPAVAGIQTTYTVPGQGTFVVNTTTGVVTFTPVSNFNGTTTPIPYSVCDNGTPLPAQCATATITVNVTPVNDPPVAVNDVATTPEDAPVTIPILNNDSDTDGSLVPGSVDLDPATSGTQTSFTVPGQGTFTVDPSGIVTFTPVTNFNGTTTPVTYSVCDNGTPLPAQCATATITVNVTPVNDPPVAVNDVATTPEDTPVTIPVLANDSDPDGSLVPGSVDLDPLTLGTQTTFTVPGQGTFTVNPSGVVTFTPVLNYNGTTTPISYSVCDNGTPLPAQCATATITVTVTPVNDPPVAVNDVATTPEDSPVTIPVTSNDTDVDGAINPATLDLDPVTPGIQTSFTVPNQGTFVANPANGNVTFTPVTNFNGTTTPVTYSVCDNGTPLPAQCATATITVNVTPVNDPPVAVNDVATTPEDTPVTIPVTSNDTDVDGAINPATLDLDPATPGVQTSFTVPNQGTFVANPANGNVTFTPVLNFNGTTTPIPYNVCDNGTPLPAQCASATITVTVTPVNDPPVAVNDVASTPEDNPVTIPILNNDSDVDGSLVPSTVDLDPLTPGIQTSFTVPGQGTFVVNTTTGVVTFTPVPNYSGTTTPITYSVCDNGTPLPAQCATATITVNVIFDPVAKLQLKVLLQGALIGSPTSLMRDDLRSGGYIPLTEPYTALAIGNARFTQFGGGGGETTTSTVLAANAGTPDAIVDWVFVELRSATDPTVIVQTRSALVQRDGDVVSAADGVSKVTFNGIVGQQFYIAVKHRNHLGAMMAAPVTMSNDATIVDFTTASDAQVYDRPGGPNYNGSEMVLDKGVRALWAGNCNANTKVKYQGTLTDNTTIITQALGFAGNVAGTYNYNNALGYFLGDVNMDGRVKYQGTFNDPSYIFVNVIGLYTSLNTALLYNYDLFLEQLP